MFLRQPWTHILILTLLLAGLPGRLPAQETETDARVARLVARILKANESDPPAVLLPGESRQLRWAVAGELLRQRERLPDVVLTMLSVDEKKFKPERGIRESTETILRSFGPSYKASVSPVLAGWLLSESQRKRQLATEAMRNLDGLSRDAVPNLVRATRSQDSQTRADACLALGWVEPPPRSAEDDIRKCLADLKPDLRYAPAAALLAIDNNDEEAMRILIDTLVNANEEENDTLALDARMALRKAGPGLVQFSERWRQDLWSELDLLLQGREREVVPILLGWLRNKKAPEWLRIEIILTMPSVSVITPEVRDTLIAVINQPPQDGADYPDYVANQAHILLRRAGGFDPNKVAAFVARDPGSLWVEDFMESLATCSDDPKKQAEALRGYMKHPDPHVRWEAKSQMAKLGLDDPEVLEFVRELLTAEKPGHRAHGASRARPFAQESGLFVDELFAILEDRSRYDVGESGPYYVNESAVPGLAALGNKALPRLIERLEHRDAAVRGLAARALGRSGDPAAVAPLAKVLVDSHPELKYWRTFDSPEKVRLEALRALASIGGPHIQHLLPEFEMLVEHDWSRRDAVHAIAQVGPPGHPLLLRLMRISEENADQKLDRALRRAFTRLSPQDPFALIGMKHILEKKKQEMPTSGGHTTFFKAMKLVQSLGPNAKPLIPVLEGIVEDEELVDYAVRAYAAAALAVIDRENPRWQAMVDRWQSGPWLDEVSGYPTTERTIWLHLIELEEHDGG